MIPYPSPLVEGRTLRRYKRFLADVLLADGTEVTAHCANPGSMKTAWEDDAPCRLSVSDNPKRKLPYTLEQVQVDGTWVMVHPTHANRVVEAALEAGRLSELGEGTLRREVRYGSEGSRVDFLLEGERRTWIEVKHVTLRHQGHGMFPDSVSKRGTRHLRELIARVEAGDRAVLLFHVGRSDVEAVAPAAHIDPEYAQTLREALEAGVEVVAYRCEVGGEGLVLGASLPVVLEPGSG